MYFPVPRQRGELAGKPIPRFIKTDGRSTKGKFTTSLTPQPAENSSSSREPPLTVAAAACPFSSPPKGATLRLSPV